MRLMLGLCSAALVASCATDGAIDGESDRYIIGGKADTGGIQEGTDEAAAVLHVASTWSRADLLSDVTLATKAVDNLIAYRNGDDETAGTADDQVFDTLAELDSVPFMGPIAFGKLLAYAEANDIVGDVPASGAIDDPFNPASCQGAKMSQAAARSRWQTNARLGDYQLAIRRRNCTSSTDESTCGAWENYPVANLDWRFDASGRVELIKVNDEMRIKIEARQCSYGSGYAAGTALVGTTCDGVGFDLVCYSYNVSDRCNPPYPHEDSDNLRLPNGRYIDFQGTLTENCIRVSDKDTSSSAVSGTYRQYETVLLSKF